MGKGNKAHFGEADKNIESGCFILYAYAFSALVAALRLIIDSNNRACRLLDNMGI